MGGDERHSEVADPPGAVGYRGQLTVYPVVHLFPMIVSGPKAVMRFSLDPTSRMLNRVWSGLPSFTCPLRSRNGRPARYPWPTGAPYMRLSTRELAADGADARDRDCPREELTPAERRKHALNSVPLRPC